MVGSYIEGLARKKLTDISPTLLKFLQGGRQKVHNLASIFGTVAFDGLWLRKGVAYRKRKMNYWKRSNLV